METNSTCSIILSSTASIAVAVMNAVSCVLSVGGNSLVLLVMIRSPSLRSTSNLFIASLAFADLIVGVLANPLYVFLSLLGSLRGVWEIKNTESFVWLLTVIATTFNLCAVSIDRYIAVTKPLRYYALVTVPRCQIVIGCTWAFAIVFSSFSFFLPRLKLPSLWVTGSLMTVVLPLFIISFCYYKIWKEVRLQRKRIVAVEVSVEVNSIYKEESMVREKNKKAAWTFAITIALFGILSLPTVGTKFMSMSATKPCDFYRLNRIWFWTAAVSYFSSALNPWVYAIRMGEFRAAFKKILMCRK